MIITVKSRFTVVPKTDAAIGGWSHTSKKSSLYFLAAVARKLVAYLVSHHLARSECSDQSCTFSSTVRVHVLPRLQESGAVRPAQTGVHPVEARSRFSLKINHPVLGAGKSLEAPGRAEFSESKQGSFAGSTDSSINALHECRTGLGVEFPTVQPGDMGPLPGTSCPELREDVRC
jgi:hypothetical protein